MFLKIDHLAEETIEEIETILHSNERPSRGRFQFLIEFQHHLPTANSKGNRFIECDYWSGQMMLEFYKELEGGNGPVFLKIDHLAEETMLESEFGIGLGHADLKIEAITADSEAAQHLNVEEGSAVLRIQRLVFSQDGEPIDFEYLSYRGDAFQYQLRVGRQ